MPWSVGAAFGSRTLIAELMPCLRGTALEARGLRRRNHNLAEGTTLDPRVPAAGTTA